MWASTAILPKDITSLAGSEKNKCSAAAPDGYWGEVGQGGKKERRGPNDHEPGHSSH